MALAEKQEKKSGGNERAGMEKREKTTDGQSRNLESKVQGAFGSSHPCGG
jgi:hypothetical protein